MPGSPIEFTAQAVSASTLLATTEPHPSKLHRGRAHILYFNLHLSENIKDLHFLTEQNGVYDSCAKWVGDRLCGVFCGLFCCCLFVFKSNLWLLPAFLARGKGSSKLTAFPPPASQSWAMQKKKVRQITYHRLLLRYQKGSNKFLCPSNENYPLLLAWVLLAKVVRQTLVSEGCSQQLSRSQRAEAIKLF